MNCESFFSRRETQWFIWLRHCATSRKVAGSIPDVVIAILCWRYPSGRTMTLASTQSLTEMSNRIISWSGRCLGLTTLPPSCAECLEIRDSQPIGTVWAFPGIALPLLHFSRKQFSSVVSGIKFFSFLRNMGVSRISESFISPECNNFF